MGLGRESGRRIRFEGWDVCVHPYDLTVELTPWYDESCFYLANIYRQRWSPMQIDDEEIGGMEDFPNNKVKSRVQGSDGD